MDGGLGSSLESKDFHRLADRAPPYPLAGMKKVLILGSTGSIGTQALEVIGRSPELQAVGLAAGSGWETVVGQAREHEVPAIALADEGSAEKARGSWSGRVLTGDEGIRELIGSSGADPVLNSIVGAAGLGSTIVALTEGIDVALANKESLVLGGELVMALAEATGARLLPVDSEHSALFQLINAEAPGSVEKLVLTASGGPFRGREDLSEVSVGDALAHPTWRMGGRITIDSATLMNKGFEAIEAHHFFAVPYERIGVVVHPQSLIHSLIHLNDGSTLAHLGYPDMRVPISYALHYPERADVDVPQLDLAAVGSLTFEEPDLQTFGCLRLALEAGRAGGTAPCVLNAADEVAVAAFLEERIPFPAIPAVIERVLEEMPAQAVSHFDDLFAADAEARERTQEQVRELAPA
jgi:1-deoxy-D-xylulose-5-phosphate reductoisomerase